jgi:iron complex outermembrane receptor protein
MSSAFRPSRVSNSRATKSRPHIQSLTAGCCTRTGCSRCRNLLGSRISGINVNEIQGNPYQADVNFRGFSASPLLGTPQGISVYQDGVRINEPFGDTVNWDLVPRAAVSSIDLIPGSNPLFGLNTLGGALSIRTKDGFANPGASIDASGGSFGRRQVEAGFGGKQGDLGLFVAGSTFREDGWRDFSPSRGGPVVPQTVRSSVGLWSGILPTPTPTQTWSATGCCPISMLQARRGSIFTKPDNTRNRLHLLSFGLSYWLDDKARLTGTVYHRSNRVKTLNGDANDAFEGDGRAGRRCGRQRRPRLQYRHRRQQPHRHRSARLGRRPAVVADRRQQPRRLRPDRRLQPLELPADHRAGHFR